MENEGINYSDYFVVDPESPTGLRWRDDVVRRTTGTKGGNCWGGTPAGNFKSSKGRVKQTVVTVNTKRYSVSRIVWTIVHGEIPKGMVIDHLDGDPWNNRIENLALKTHGDNLRNCKMRKDNTSGVVGVRFVVDSGRTSCIGYYEDENSKTRVGSFSVKKHGLLPAFKLAVEFRRNGLELMNEKFNLKYTERHISGGI